ncbi:MAG: pyridinium-3,5-bisthiocarboxylic acid mononucleotide nickel chelatase [Abditibacteriota bacterium]|nr:pyridinium-3,5-bisthiocarboxylic acid mononucleotide nickel chelatase [Abditibacteriota bacterium]
MIAYFDCFSGIAGDMLLGALLDCGVPLDKLREELKSLPVEGWELEATPVLKSGIHALKVHITLHGRSDADELAQIEAHRHAHAHTHEPHHEHAHHGHSHEETHRHQHAHEHEHEHEHHHAHEHEHEHTHVQEHMHEHAHPHEHGRSMAEIRELIQQSTLSDRVKQMSLDVFWRIAQVEAKMHHTTPEEIHFHEIGGLDSMLDIIGACWCLDYLEVEEIHCSPLPHSTGFVNCAHGRMPVPAPATQELLVGVPMIPTDIRGEMVTPTGAGLVAVLAQKFGPMPAMTPRHSGFGAGTKDWPDRPNMLRVVIGEKAGASLTQASSGSAPTAAHHDLPVQSTLAAELGQSAQLAGLEWRALAVVECNIDDMNPEFFSLVMERLFESGALDVWVQPLQMKKNRPAWLLSALADKSALDGVIATILRETSTLGVRVQQVLRAALPRDSQSVETPFGAVRVKFARWKQGSVLRAAPEWADVEQRARQHNVPAREVYQAAIAAAHGYHTHDSHAHDSHAHDSHDAHSHESHESDSHGVHETQARGHVEHHEHHEHEHGHPHRH